MRYPGVKSVKTIKTNKALTLNWDNTNKINFTDGGLLGAYFVEATVKHIGELSVQNHHSFERNFEKWKIFDKKIHLEPEEILAIHSFDGQVDYLKDWLTNRIQWLTDYYEGREEDFL